jgi:hypothetical protein
MRLKSIHTWVQYLFMHLLTEFAYIQNRLSLHSLGGYSLASHLVGPGLISSQTL